MFRHLTEPLHAGGLEPHIRIEAARNRSMNDRLLFLFEELDELLFRTNIAANAAVGVT